MWYDVAMVKSNVKIVDGEVTDVWRNDTSSVLAEEAIGGRDLSTCVDISGEHRPGAKVKVVFGDIQIVASPHAWIVRDGWTSFAMDGSLMQGLPDDVRVHIVLEKAKE